MPNHPADDDRPDIAINDLKLISWIIANGVEPIGVYVIKPRGFTRAIFEKSAKVDALIAAWNDAGRAEMRRLLDVYAATYARGMRRLIEAKMKSPRRRRPTNHGSVKS